MSALAAFCFGCAPLPFEPHGACLTSDTIDRIYVEDERDCYCLGDVIDDARAGLVAAGAVPSDFDFGGVDVWIHAKNARLDGGNRPWGRYVPTGDGRGEIETSRYADTIAHELLHHFDVVSGASLEQTARHEGWAQRGWTEIAQALRGRALAAACR